MWGAGLPRWVRQKNPGLGGELVFPHGCRVANVRCITPHFLLVLSPPRPLLHLSGSLRATEVMSQQPQSQFVSLCWFGTAPSQAPWQAAHLSAPTYDPSTSMKMKVFRMFVVCFFQELQSSSSFRPIASRVEASGDAFFEEREDGG